MRHASACLALLLVLWARAAAADDPRSADGSQSPWRWFDVRNSPFIPLPEVGTDPNAGTTFGFLPIFLLRGADGGIGQIIAPDLVGNAALGFGAHMRFFSYPSPDEEWHVVAGGMQVIERNFDALYSRGIERQTSWSITTQLHYDRIATGRFYGIGNNTAVSERTNYTGETAYARINAGWNLGPQIQIAFESRPRFVNIERGTLEQSINAALIGGENDFFNRVSITYDSRDSPTLPTRGSAVTAFAGISMRPVLSSISYQKAGVDMRHFVPIGDRLVLAAHVALQYMPGVANAPFWALNSLGGEQSNLGEGQPLRGFGEGRFIERNLFSSSVELRARVFDLQLFTQNVTFEAAPFLDAGRVFHSADENPVSRLHVAGGLGFRAVARPFIVGYVDIGYGTEGAAIFTGIHYPF